jgi:N-methylhydantoinase A/oxoprolinase/acetone carboxylase beta subunit
MDIAGLVSTVVATFLRDSLLSTFKTNLPILHRHLEDLRDKCVSHLKSEGFAESNIRTEDYLHMRYNGTDCALVIKTHQFWHNLEQNSFIVK